MSASLQSEPLLNGLCLIFFVDETGHEEFADPNYPVFGLGGCAIMAALLEREIQAPWRAMKERHFGGAGVPIHSSQDWNDNQMKAVGEFFKSSRFMRFAQVIHKGTQLPHDVSPYEALVKGGLLDRFKEITQGWVPRPEEVWFIHEASTRGDKPLMHHVGKLTLKTESGEIPVRQSLMEKSVGEPGLEVAHFVVQAAGSQTLKWSKDQNQLRKDYKAVFDVEPFLVSFRTIESYAVEPPRPVTRLG